MNAFIHAHFAFSDTEAVVTLPQAELGAALTVPARAVGVVVFAHGSGSTRRSPRNQHVAYRLQEAGLATLLVDLLTPEEILADEHTGAFRFNIPYLARRLKGITAWAHRHPELQGLPLGLFGASTGGAAALVAAADLGAEVSVVVSRGGRPDLAEHALPLVKAPTLLIVGAKDHPVLGLNAWALERLTCKKRLETIPGAGHLFEEPGTLGLVADLAADWFVRHLRTAAGA